VVYHFFQLPPEANMGELDAVGARWCGTEWGEVDRSRGRETQVRAARVTGPTARIRFATSGGGLGVSDRADVEFCTEDSSPSLMPITAWRGVWCIKSDHAGAKRRLTQTSATGQTSVHREMLCEAWRPAVIRVNSKHWLTYDCCASLLSRRVPCPHGVAELAGAALSPCAADVIRMSTASQVEQYCFRAPYITEMLRQGLGISAQQIRIGGGDVAWTLGARPPAHTDGSAC